MTRKAPEPEHGATPDVLGCHTPDEPPAERVAVPVHPFRLSRRGITMNDRPRQLFRRSRIVLCVLVAVVPLAGCDDDSPTAPERSATIGPTSTATAIPTVTPTPTAGPLAVAEFSLVPTSSSFLHAFRVHVDVRETRGVPITVTSLGVASHGGGYTFPAREWASATLQLPAFGTGTLDHLVEHDADIPCDQGLLVGIEVWSPDGRTGTITHEFNCTTGYWPLG